jgi:uncharacterized iron-regulated protein
VHPTLNYRRLACSLAAVAGLSFFAGCASSPHGEGEHAQTISATDTRAVPIFRADGSPASWSDVVAAATSSDVVIFGENHGHPLGLAAADAIFEDALPKSPSAALALEFFERDEQSRLNDYLTNVTDEATFRKRTGRTGDSYPPGHRAMVEAAKAAHRPVIAANAPRPYVRLARLEGYDRLAALTPEQRRLFRIPDELPAADNPYRIAFAKIMSPGSAHTKPGTPTATPDPKAEAEHADAIAASFRSQSMWDWTMSESVARAANDGNRPVFLVVGRFHIDHDGGLVQALRKQRPQTSITTISFVDQPAPATFPDADKNQATFIIYVGTSN